MKENRQKRYGDETIIAATIFVLVLFTYEQTLHPSVPGGDAGELITEAWQLGLPHPPGYPTFSMLGHLFSRKLNIAASAGNAVSKVAWRLNFMSAILTSLSAVFIFLMIQNMKKMLWRHREDCWVAAEYSSFPWFLGSIVASLMYSFCPLIWTYAVTAEVFALNNFFASYILFLATDFFTQPTMQKGYYGAFVCGLGLTNQHSLIFFIIPLAIGVLGTNCYINYNLQQSATDSIPKRTNEGKNNKNTDIANDTQITEVDTFVEREKQRNISCLSKSFSWQNIYYVSVSIASFLLGLVPYIYMPYATGKPNSWGDATTIAGFLKHLLRQEYGTFLLHPDMVGTESMQERTKLYLENILQVSAIKFFLMLHLTNVDQPSGTNETLHFERVLVPILIGFRYTSFCAAW